MLIWSRHNRPGPAVAQSPHNNPPRPRLSLLPPLRSPPAPRSPGFPARPRRALPRRQYHSAPQGGSGRRGGVAGDRRGGGARGSPASRQTGLPSPRSLIKSPQRRRRLSDFLPRGRSAAGAEAPADERDSLPSRGGRNAASVRKAGATRGARVLGAAPPFSEGVAGRMLPGGSAALFGNCAGLAVRDQGPCAGVQRLSRACSPWSPAVEQAALAFPGPSGRRTRLGRTRCRFSF